MHFNFDRSACGILRSHQCRGLGRVIHGCVVSLRNASYLYARSTLIPYSVLLALSFILIELLVVVYFSLLSEFSSSIFGKKKDIPVPDQADIVQAVPAQLIDAQASPVPPDPDNMGQTQPVHEEQTEELQAPDPTSEERAISTGHESASTDVTVQEQQKKREKFALDRKEIMQEYIYYSLGPLLDEQDILAVWLEYEGWISSSTYQPKPRLCKWKEKVTSRDVRHLTWNIAKRMGMENGYKSETCGRFVKAMFPDLCVKRDGSPCTDSYLSQNLLEEKPDDLIKIDKPEPHSIAFHFRNMEMKQAV